MCQVFALGPCIVPLHTIEPVEAVHRMVRRLGPAPGEMVVVGVRELPHLPQWVKDDWPWAEIAASCGRF